MVSSSQRKEAFVDQRLSVVTLGVDDLEHSRRFYEALGWESRAEPHADIVFFQAGGMIVALWDRALLAKDSGVDDAGTPAFGGVTLAQNVASPEEVDQVIAHAESAGAVVARAPTETAWGGYSGVFLDPDGHPWEVAYNPHWRLLPDGRVFLHGDETEQAGSRTD